MVLLIPVSEISLCNLGAVSLLVFMNHKKKTCRGYVLVPFECLFINVWTNSKGIIMVCKDRP